MNYLAHGRKFTGDPYFLAGTAVPDWLSVIDRKVRVRSKAATPFVSHDDSLVAAVARGIVQHHVDDDWFHRTRAFLELSTDFTDRIVRSFPSDTGPRAGFLGHILVELLLDAALVETTPELPDRYYAALAEAEPAEVNRAVNLMASQTTEHLVLLIPRFSAERFLNDYTADAKLWARLNAVMRRVGLAPLPEEFIELLSRVRPLVYARQLELLTPE